MRRASVARVSAAPAAQAVRASTRGRVDRVEAAWLPILQTGVAAALAWVIAQQLVGPRPFFAPVAAVISLGLARGQPRRRAVELALGVAVGIGVADLVVRVIGSGAVQIAAVVSLTMAVALFVGAGNILVNQAAVSAILVMTLPTTAGGAVTDRFVDALIGGAMALLLSQVLFPQNPVKIVARAAAPVLQQLATALGEAERAMIERDPQPARDALERARALDDGMASFYDAVALARETSHLSPPRRSMRGHLEQYADAARQVDFAVRNTRVLARSVVAALRRGAEFDPSLAASVATLRDTVLHLRDDLSARSNPEETRRLAIRAAQQATQVIGGRERLGSITIVGQVRATAIDLLRSSGLDEESAQRAIDADPV
jgi:uncharacterized membrane protein YgaE (UPF0421/DUF939 family)